MLSLPPEMPLISAISSAARSHLPEDQAGVHQQLASGEAGGGAVRLAR